MTTMSWLCPRCRTEQSIGANAVVARIAPEGPRCTVECSTCTTRVDTPVDVETFRAVVTGALAVSVAEAGLSELLSRRDAADVIGRSHRG